MGIALVTTILVGCGKDTPPPVAEPANQGAADTDQTVADPQPPPAPAPRTHLAPAGTTLTAGATPEELEAAKAKWDPQLPPDKIDVVPAPGVDVLSQAKQNQVVVSPDTLRFKAADHADVLTWEKGKVLVAAPAEKGSVGRNPFGFARKVERVEQVEDDIVVTTKAAALEEIIHGEFQLEFDPETAQEVEWADFEATAEWAASTLYTNSIPSGDHYPPGLRDDTPPAAQRQPTPPNGDPLCCFIDTLVDAGKDVGRGIANKVGSAANAVVNVAKTVGGAVADGAKAVGGAVADGAKAVGGAVVSAAQTVGGVVVSTASGAAQTVSSISQAIYQEARAIYEAVMPKSFGGEASLEPEFDFDAIDLSIVKYNIKKTFNESGDFPIQAEFSADSNLKGNLLFKPKLSIGAEIPNPIAIGDIPPLRVWLDVNASLTAKLTLDLELMASLTSAGGKAGSKLEEALNQISDFAGPVINTFRKEVFGNKDVKPAGNWKKTVFLSKPKVKAIMLGKVPVVMTGTFQIDVDCGFELKAQLNAEATLESVHTFTYRAEYVQGTGIKQNKPKYDHTPRTEVKVLGGGEASVACSIIPRINVFLYDTIGLNAGVRGSIIASAEYESTCSAAKTQPDGEVSLSLKAGIGIPVGARLQAPGSSWGGKESLDMGVELGPFEIWNTEFKILEKSWDVPGLGYCTPTCSNGRKGDKEPETDIDCGGECPVQCAENKMCKANSDCASGLFCVSGTCSKSHCNDGVLSGTESGVDCGGPTCAPCAAGGRCIKDGDCASSACAHQSMRLPFGGKTITLPWGQCAADPCTDGQRSPGECAIDCGGKCPLCPVGALCGDATQCASGQSNRYQCTSTCDNLKVDGGETDLDCGGDTSCNRCAAGKRCTEARDCMASAPFCSKDGLCARHPCGSDPVVSAIYGLPDRNADVTARVNELYVGQQRRFDVRNHILNIDPAYGHKKKLTVTYLDDQCEHVTKTVDEREVFEF